MSLHCSFNGTFILLINLILIFNFFLKFFQRFFMIFFQKRNLLLTQVHIVLFFLQLLLQKFYFNLRTLFQGINLIFSFIQSNSTLFFFILNFLHFLHNFLFFLFSERNLFLQTLILPFETLFTFGKNLIFGFESFCFIFYTFNHFVEVINLLLQI